MGTVTIVDKILTRGVNVNYDALTESEKQNVTDTAVESVKAGEGEFNGDYGISIAPDSTVDIALVGHEDELKDIADVMCTVSRVIADNNPTTDSDRNFVKATLMLAESIRDSYNTPTDNPQGNNPVTSPIAPPSSPINPPKQK